MVDNLESLCWAAKESLIDARAKLGEAAWCARETGNYELDKSLTAAAHAVEGIQLLLISLPRLEDKQ